MPAKKIRKSYRSVTGLIATKKSGEMTFYKTKLEHDCQKLVAFNHNIARYEVQPVTIPYVDKNGKDRTYTPGILIHYRKDVAPASLWKPLLADVRGRSELFKKWKELKPKFLAGRQYAKEQGLDFAVLTEHEINTPYLKNARFLLVFIDYPVNEEDMKLLLRVLNDAGEIDAETLMCSVAKDNYRRAELLPALWKLVANFEIGTNLEAPLNMHSRLLSTALWEEMTDESINERRAGHARQLRWRALRYYPHLES